MAGISKHPLGMNRSWTNCGEEPTFTLASQRHWFPVVLGEIHSSNSPDYQQSVRTTSVIFSDVQLLSNKPLSNRRVALVDSLKTCG